MWHLYDAMLARLGQVPKLMVTLCAYQIFFFFFVDKGDILPKTFEKIHNLRMQEQDSHKTCTILRNILKNF